MNYPNFRIDLVGKAPRMRFAESTKTLKGSWQVGWSAMTGERAFSGHRPRLSPSSGGTAQG
ncbi:hypothetical protein [Bradyrhizobium sp. CCBAU 53340]|uniref:hypothetical protein n=1 Tax=Bradyrhizobium sp. CCBAU 53340 TaxID=1325112 RepID=UPI00188BE902|nr:hypothetical protein [Bradyrhizobium sp. CCBAU 53340]